MKEKRNRKNIRALLALLCSAGMMYNSLVPALVIQAAADDEKVETIEETYVNPLYENIINEDDLSESDQMLSYYTLERDESQVFSSPSQAAEYLRDEMEARNEEIHIRVLVDEYYKGLLKEISDQAVVHTGVPTEGDYIRWQFGGWKTKGQVSETDGKELVDATYFVTYYTSAEQEKEVDEKVETVLSDLSAQFANKPETVEAIYDYICTHVVYDHDHLNDNDYKLQFTAYAALVNGTSVCQGYSVLLYRLLLEMGIDTRVITGKGNGGPHGWNIVQLGDLYYNADTTWDAGENQKSWYLLSPSSFKNHTRDEEFTTASFTDQYPMGSVNYEKEYSGSVAWSEDYSQAQGIFSVTGDSKVYSLPAEVIKLDDSTEPTCTEAGHLTANAEAEWKNGHGEVLAFAEDTIDQTLPALGHDYSVRFIWDDLKQAKAQAVCSRCQNILEQTVNAEIDSDASQVATCVSEGKEVYRVKAIFKDEQGKTIAQGEETKTKVLPKVAHVPVVQIKWNNSDPVVTAYCQTCQAALTCDKNVQELTESEIKPTCQNEGEKVYRAVVRVFDENKNLLKTVEDEHMVAIPRLKHEIDPDSVSFTWTDYSSAKAKAQCKNCKEWLQADEVSIQKDEQNSILPTTKEEGKNIWIATAVFRDSNGQELTRFTDTQTEILPVLQIEIQAMYRLYNPNSGEHFYTAQTDERDMLINLGWKDEKIGWYAPSESNTPVYRLYNPNAGDHHYTTSAGERDALVKVGWIYEKIGWYSSDEKEIPVYRQYNPNAKKAGAHNYTTNKAENDMLASIGWNEEGIGWYGCQQ